MKLNKKQRILGCVLAVGGCAIAFDKFVLGYSDPAAAAAEPVASAPAAPSAPAASASVAQSKPAPATRAAPAPAKSLTSEIARLSAAIQANSSAGIDPFVPPASWTIVSHSPSTPAGDTPAPAAEPSREQPVTIKLSMVLVPAANSPDTAIAVLDGQPYPLGSTIDGFTIASITSERVLLRKDKRIVELTIPRPNDRVDRR